MSGIVGRSIKCFTDVFKRATKIYRVVIKIDYSFIRHSACPVSEEVIFKL